MPDFETEGFERKELPHGSDFTQDPYYNEGKAPTRSDPRELEQVRKRHQEEMEEMDENPDSGSQSPILLPPRPQRQRMDRDGMSNEMRNFLKVPRREDDEEVVDDTTRVYIPPEPSTIPPKLDLAQYARENPIGEEERSVEKRVQVPNLCNSKYAPTFDFSGVFGASSKMISESGSPPSLTEVASNVSEKAALDEITQEISACGDEYDSHVSDSSQSGDDPTEFNIRGRPVSVNSLMGAGPDHGCVE